MGDRGACRGGCQGSSSGVGEQVQYFYRASRVFDLFREPVPVGSLLRKESGMLKAEGFQIKSKTFVLNGPLLRQIEEFPFSAAFFAPVVVTVPVLPAGVGLGGVPDDLGVRTDQEIISPPFRKCL